MGLDLDEEHLKSLKVSTAFLIVDQKIYYAKEGDVIDCIRKASYDLQNWRLIGAVLYTWYEPDLYTLGAAFLSRVEKIVYLYHHPKGAVETFCQLFKTPNPIHQITIIKADERRIRRDD